MSRFVLFHSRLLTMLWASHFWSWANRGRDRSPLARIRAAATTKDLIFARKIVMDMIGRNMDEIDTMLQTGKIDLAEGREHADTISVMLMAFPHLFPPDSDQWKPNARAILARTLLHRRSCGRRTRISTSRRRSRPRRRTKPAALQSKPSLRSSARSCGRLAIPATPLF